MFKHKAVRLGPVLMLAIVGAAVTGCASVDPKPDIERSATVVSQRSGYTPGWNVPWSEQPADWDGSAPLSLEAAVMMALQNNRSIRSDVEFIAAGRADLVQAGLLPNPVISAGVGFADNGVTAVSGAFVQQLVALWIRPARIRAADARLNEAILRVSDTALRLVADVKITYASIAYDEKALALTRDHIRLIEQSIETMERRVRAGEAATLDVNRLHLTLLAQQVTLARLEAQVHSRRRELLELVGYAMGPADWALADTELPLIDVPSELDETAVAELAASQHLSVAASTAVVEVRRQEVTQQRLGRFQDIAVGVSYEEEPERDGTKTIGPTLAVAIPIFDQNQAQIALAGSNLRAALAAASGARQRVTRQARQAWIAFNTAERLTALYREQVVSLAERNLELTERALRAGQVDTTVLLEAQREHITRRLEVNEFQADSLRSFIELEYVVGGRLAIEPTDAPKAADGENPQVHSSRP